MNDIDTSRELIKNFIDIIWNKNDFSQLSKFLDKDFFDHSLPPNLPANAIGLEKWVVATGQAFEHYSTIEEHVTETDTSIIKFKMRLKHKGVWRDIEPNGAEVYAVGYRCFKIMGDKIIEHWALLDGNAIENQLLNSQKNCKAQQ